MLQEYAPIRRYAIAPGVELMVDPMPQSSGVALGLWFAAGSAYERDDERGLSHFVEHMVFKGAGDRDVAELSRAIDRVGGYLNAFTERETVCVHCLIPAEHASLAMEILLDMIYRPRFQRSEFEREKDVIVNEIIAAEDDLEEAAQDEFFAMIYAGHPASRRIAGKVDDVRSATFAELVAFHERRFAHGSTVISVAGAVDPDRIAEALRAMVPAGRGATQALWDPGVPPFRQSRRMVKAAGSQVYVLTGLPIDVGSSEDDFWRLGAASSAYGESMSSRLFLRLREEQGLCYGISSAVSLSRMAGLWGVSSSTTPSQLPRFAEAYLREARALHEQGLTEVEVAEAVSRIRGLLELASDDPEYRMKRIARQYLFEDKTEPVSVTMDRLNLSGALSADAIDSLVRRTLDPAGESVLLYGKLGQRTIRAGESLFGAVLEDALDGPEAKDATHG